MTDTISTIAYVDCFSGISGDMFLGALVDAGLPEQILREELALLGIGKYALDLTANTAGSIKSAKVHVTAEGDQPHRSWKTIRNIIEQSKLSDPIKEKAIRIFSTLAEAEAQVHGCDIDDVHFHEVGSVDSIIDIVGTAVGLTHLGINQIISSPLPMPNGWVSCEHGKLPLPAPAVCEILKNVPIYGVDLKQELVTPTGAAIVKSMASEFGPFPSMTIKQVGYGAGSRKLSNQQPNLLRLVIGEKRIAEEAQEVEVIETNLDDWSPEGFPYVSDLLFKLGALDVSLVPIQMKKGRPGFLLRVISDVARAFDIKQCILSETTAIGLRYRTEKRWTLPREKGTVTTQWGDVQVKKVETPKGVMLYPEYEDCKRVAAKKQIPLKAIYGEISGCSPEKFKKDLG